MSKKASDPYRPCTTRSFLIELDDRVVKLLGQLVHLRLMDEPDSVLAKETLNQLVLQTSVVSKNPMVHGIIQISDSSPTHTKLRVTQKRLYREVQ